jgi:hypothetical protein
MSKQKGWSTSKNSSSLKRFVIMCKVSGGVTGTRTGPMKNADGSILYFTDKDVAQTMADYYNEKMNGNLNQPAKFSYWVEPE